MSSKTYVGQNASATFAGLNCTFTAEPIGSAAADRKVVVVVTSVADHTAYVSACTIGGNAATLDKRISADASGDSPNVAIFSLDVPSGTTANIVTTVAAGAAVYDVVIFVYALYGVGAAADTASIAGTSAGLQTVNVDVDVAPDTIIIAGKTNYQDNGFTSNWTGVTKDDDFNYFGDDPSSVASHLATSTETPRTVSVQINPNVDVHWCAVAVAYPAAPTSKTYIGATPTYLDTLTGYSIGSAAADRRVIAVYGASASNGITNYTATIDGQAMTKDGMSIGEDGSNHAGLTIFSKAWPSGTTADFVFTPDSALVYGAAAAIFVVYGCDAAADSATSVGGDNNGTGTKVITLDADTAVDSVVIAAGYAYNVTGAVTGWSGVTADGNTNNYGSHYLSLASHLASSTEAPRAISGTHPMIDSTGRVWAGVSVVYPATVVAATDTFGSRISRFNEQPMLRGPM